LLYLHHCCDKCIVHGDIKPENVMLDALFNAKLSDFGTARLVEHRAEPRTTEIIAGTRGYIDPDFVNSHLRCPEADMYSFGVALLEIASGKRPASI
jgi:serine/threonine protein kinase